MRRGTVAHSFSAAVVGLLIVIGTACGGGGGSASQASFCGSLKDGVSKYANLGDMSDPKTMNDAVTFLRGLESKAPSEIKADMKIMVDAMAAFVQKGTVPDLAKLEAASNNLTKYAKDKCGVDLDSTSSSSGNAAARSSSSGSGSAAALGNSQICTDLGNISGTGSDDPRAAIARLRSVTPPAEIKAEWKDFIDGAEAFLSGNFSDSALMQRYGLAAAKVSGYVLQQCAGVSADFFSDLTSSSS